MESNGNGKRIKRMLPSHSSKGKRKNNLLLLLILVFAGSCCVTLLSYLRSFESQFILSSSNVQQWSMPIYYINMDEDTSRNEYMQSVWSLRVTRLYRVPAIKTTDMDVLLEYLDPASVVDAQRLRKDKHYETFRVYKALPGQIGNLISHMRAIEQAYDNGEDYAIIMEDDVGDATLSLWPYSDPKHLVQIADAQFKDEWKVIRLQWNDYEWNLRKIHNEWLQDMDDWASTHVGEDLNHITQLWMTNGSIALYNDIPLLKSLPQGWGNVAAIFNRRGMKDLLDIHRVNHHGSSRWRCNPNLPCQADISFWQELQTGTLVVVPPMLTYRLAEVQTKAIRAGEVKRDHKKLHLQSVATTIQWLLELQEFFRIGGGLANIPQQYTWVVLSNSKK